MEQTLARYLGCAVCGIDATDHAGWFLVIENHWLDRLKILSWHPALAEQHGMLSACGRRHLKEILLHWLTQGNLEYPSPLVIDVPVPEADKSSDFGPHRQDMGMFLGELTVHRHALTHVWTGSPQALECILNAVLGGTTPRPRSRRMPLIDRSQEHRSEMALH